MIQRISAGILGLAAFLGMLLAGYLAANPFTTIIVRALVGMAGGLAVGFLGGCVAQAIVHESVAKMVEADGAAELAAAPAEIEETKKNKVAKASENRQGKEDTKDGRSTNGPLRDGTFSAKAAEALFSES